MAEKRAASATGRKKKPVKKIQAKKAVCKKLIIEADAIFLEELERYIQEFGIKQDEFVRKAVLEKISRDKINRMIELASAQSVI